MDELWKLNKFNLIKIIEVLFSFKVVFLLNKRINMVLAKIIQDVHRCLRLMNLYAWKQSHRERQLINDEEHERLINLLKDLLPQAIRNLEQFYKTTSALEKSEHYELHQNLIVNLGFFSHIRQNTRSQQHLPIIERLPVCQPAPTSVEQWMQAIEDYFYIFPQCNETEIIDLLNKRFRIKIELGTYPKRTSYSRGVAGTFSLLAPYLYYLLEANCPIVFTIASVCLTHDAYAITDLLTRKLFLAGSPVDVPPPESIIEMIDVLGARKTIEFLERDITKLQNKLSYFETKREQEARAFGFGSLFFTTAALSTGCLGEPTRSGQYSLRH